MNRLAAGTRVDYAFSNLLCLACLRTRTLILNAEARRHYKKIAPTYRRMLVTSDSTFQRRHDVRMIAS